MKDRYSEGYNKAIDDFAEKMKQEYENAVCIPEVEVEFGKLLVDKVREQLKGGI